MKTRGFEVVTTYTDKGIALPARKTGCSAGYDLAAAEDVLLAPNRVTLVPTGLKAYMQPDEYLDSKSCVLRQRRRNYRRRLLRQRGKRRPYFCGANQSKR